MLDLSSNVGKTYFHATIKTKSNIKSWFWFNFGGIAYMKKREVVTLKRLKEQMNIVIFSWHIQHMDDCPERYCQVVR